MARQPSMPSYAVCSSPSCPQSAASPSSCAASLSCHCPSRLWQEESLQSALSQRTILTIRPIHSREGGRGGAKSPGNHLTNTSRLKSGRVARWAWINASILHVDAIFPAQLSIDVQISRGECRDAECSIAEDRRGWGESREHDRYADGTSRGLEGLRLETEW
jgi:hypothetical protein